MSFAVRLSSDLISVEAGATMPLSIEIVNRAEEADRFELEIEGLDPEWTAIPVPSFVVGPGETTSERVFFRPSRTPESQSGNYPFVAKIRSLNSGDQRKAQGVLQVQPFHHISADLSPKKAVVASFKRSVLFTLTLINLGNVEHTLQLFGSDSDENLTFDFEQDQITLGPGQQKEVALTIQPTSKAFLSSVKLHGFSVSARSVDTPAVVAVAQAQVEQRPTLTFSGLIFWVIVVSLAAAWWKARPQPPTLAMGLSQGSIMRGDSVDIWWRSSFADKVHISAGGKTWDSADPNGKVTFIPEKSGAIDITGYALHLDKKTEEEHLTLSVAEPPPAPEPEINSFTASAKTVRVGDSVILSYKVNDAVTKLTLAPQNLSLNINASQIQVPITDEGDIKFTLVAETDRGKHVEKTLTVHCERKTEVNVIAFSALPKTMTYPGGLVKVSWQLTNAVHAEITPNNNLQSNEVDATKGTFDIWITKTTTITLTAKDKNNLPITKTALVTVEDAPPPSPSSTTSSSTPVSPPLALRGNR